MSKDEKWSTASLRVWSDTLTVVEIAKSFKRPPTRTIGLDEPLSPRNPKSKNSEYTICIWESGDDGSKPLETHITSVVRFAEEHANVLSALRSSCGMDISCAFGSPSGQDSTFIESGTLLRIGSLSLDLLLDLYPPIEDNN
jgi:hypothetical protein